MPTEKIKKLSLLVDIFGEVYLDYLPDFLGTSQEENQIQAAFSRSRYRDQFKSTTSYKTKYVDILKKINTHQPEILHIACPTQNGNLLFVSGKKYRQVTPDDFVSLIKQANANIRLIVLRAFGTQELAEKLAKEAGIVVLYTKKSEDPGRCTEFMETFYELLGNGMTISQSFELTKCLAASKNFELVQPKRNAKNQSFVKDPSPLTYATVFASTPVDDWNHALPGLAEELDAINNNASEFELDLSYPADKKEIVMKLAYTRPEVAHFSSHAGPDMVAFYAPDGTIVELEKYWLIKVFKQFRSIIHCLILNSCENELVAYRLSEHIDYVIGTKQSIGDASAVKFADIFYSELAYQGPKKNYQQAFMSAYFAMAFFDPFDYQLFSKKKYNNYIAMKYDDRMLATEEEFLNRYGDINDENIHLFKSRYESWYSQLREFPGMESMIENFLKNFSYYSEKHVNLVLKRLFGYLMSHLKNDDPELERTIFCPLPTQKNRINSSFEYWTMFHLLNGIDKTNCKPFLQGHEEELGAVENIVFIDDFAGSGQTFIDYMTSQTDFFRNKKIYYLTVHAMEDGKKAIEKAAKKLGIALTMISMYHSKKAFQIYRIPKRNKKAFVSNCEKLGISPDRILGYDNTEALCAFYNNVPNNNLGIFFDHPLDAEDNTIFLPLFERQKAHKKAFEKPGLTDLKEKILDYYQRYEGDHSFAELQEAFHLKDYELADILVEMFENGSLVFTDDNLIRPSNARKIVVFGGSFNPPTLAHTHILAQAVEKSGADYGMFVPSSASYVRKKMQKQHEILPPFSEDLRVDMLEVCSEDRPDLLINRCELGDDGAGHSYDTMKKVQRANPNATLYYLIGADKLDILGRWHHIEEFLNEFHFLVVSREGEDVLEKIHNDSVLSRHEDRFYVVDLTTGVSDTKLSESCQVSDTNDTKDGLLDISSSKVRQALILGEDLSEMLHPEVEDMVREVLPLITSFRNEYFFLSNFYGAPVYYEGITYHNAEAAFQAQKCKTMEERKAFARLSGSEAKKLGQTVDLREDWEKVKIDLMYQIVEAKFDQNPKLKEMLIDTGNAYLIEGNDWNDTYWGMSLKTAKGDNRLGKILMTLREWFKWQ